MIIGWDGALVVVLVFYKVLVEIGHWNFFSLLAVTIADTPVTTLSTVSLNVQNCTGTRISLSTETPFKNNLEDSNQIRLVFRSTLANWLCIYLPPMLFYREHPFYFISWLWHSPRVLYQLRIFFFNLWTTQALVLDLETWIQSSLYTFNFSYLQVFVWTKKINVYPAIFCNKKTFIIRKKLCRLF